MKLSMKKRLLFIPVILICIAVLSSCSAAPKKPVLHAIIIPKFEVGEMSGDFPGEAQLFYERYCPDCAEIEIPHMPTTAHFYMNEENGVGILVTGSGKTAAGLSHGRSVFGSLHGCRHAGDPLDGGYKHKPEVRTKQH